MQRAKLFPRQVHLLSFRVGGHRASCFFVPVEVDVEKSHPSEDGEAMRGIGHWLTEATGGIAAAQMSGAMPAPKWFALYTIARHEKRVAQHLNQREIEFYLPLYRSDRKWSDGSRVTLDLPLFPGYLFVHIRRNERGNVLSVPGALAVVGGTGGEPAPLPDATIEALRTGLQLVRAQPHPLMTAGQRVRIRTGALAGLEGIVVRSKNGCRVVLTLEHIMRSYAVEVDMDDLELLTPMAFDAAATCEAGCRSDLCA
jgi:transcription antitermination factor NusG